MSKQDTFSILIIEDNPADAYLIKFYLSESIEILFRTDEVSTLTAGIELLGKKDYDIVLLDLELPDSSGAETLHRLVEEFPRSLIMVMTSLMNEKVGLEALRGGAQDFLVKGKFDSQTLTSSLLFAIERFKLRRELENFKIEALKTYERFDLIQRLCKAGFGELQIEKNKVYLSKETLQIAGINSVKYHFSSDEFNEMFSPGFDIIQKILSNPDSTISWNSPQGIRIDYRPAEGHYLFFFRGKEQLS